MSINFLSSNALSCAIYVHSLGSETYTGTILQAYKYILRDFVCYESKSVTRNLGNI